MTMLTQDKHASGTFNLMLKERIEPARIARIAGPMAAAIGSSLESVEQFLGTGPGATSRPLSRHRANELAKRIAGFGVRLEVTGKEPWQESSSVLPDAQIEAVVPQASTSPKHRFGLTAKILTASIAPLALAGFGLVGYFYGVLPNSYEHVARQAGHAAVEMFVGSLGDSPKAKSLLSIPRFPGSPVTFAELRVPSDGTALYINDGGGRFMITPFEAPSSDWGRDVANGVQKSTLSKAYPPSAYSIGADVYLTEKGLVPVFQGEQNPTAKTPPQNQRVYSLVVGLNAEGTKAAINAQTATLLAVIAALVAVVSVAAVWFSRRLVTPIVALIQSANQLSLGDLEQPIRSHSSDELGDLAAALERMRLSLKLAIGRLRRR
jgi:HAMP domain-containing protein